MTAVPDTRSFSQRYLRVVCSCGRPLRAPVEQLGASVRCWECRQAVPVSVPPSPGRTARLMSWAFRQAFAARALVGVALGALAFTVAMLLPLPEPAVAGLVLATLVFCYGELVRRFGLAGSLGNGRGVGGPRAVAARAAATLAAALVLANAWESGRVWLGYQPGMIKATLAAAVVLAVVFPLLMLTVWAAPRPRQALATIVRHPFATALAIMVVPMGLVAAEAVLVAVTSLQGYFGSYVLDLFPVSEGLAERYGIALMGNSAAESAFDPRHLSLYAHFLAHGMPLSLAVPASLLEPSNFALRPWALEVTTSEYAMMRALHTFLIAGAWLTAVTVQASCLGLLVRFCDWQQPRLTEAQPEPAPADEPQTEPVTEPAAV